MNSMRNLEKLGILVIVILVVVVGVVAITPGDQLNKALDLADGPGEVASGEGELLTPPGFDPLPRREVVEPRQRPLPPWPEEGGGGFADPDPDPVVVTPKTEPVTPVRPEPEPEPSPRFRDYVVKKGDSFWGIAAKQMGNGGKYVKTLQAANPTVSTNLLPGTVLKIPLDPDGPVARAPKQEPAPRREREDSGPGGVYIVQDGDTLSDIAREKLGSSIRWHEIQKLNNDKLQGSTRITKGMKLRLPGRERSGGSPLAMLDTPPRSDAAGKVHKVRRGETLSSIARDRLGTADRWKEIRDLNPSLGGGNLLREGATLKLPAK